MFRILPAAVLSAALAVLVAGCSTDEADVKGLSRYTPEILSQEVLARYKAALKNPPAEASAKAAAKAGRSTADDDKEKASAGTEFAPREAAGDGKGMTLDALAANTAKKVKLIEGQSAQQVLAKLDAAIDADAELAAPDKDKLKAALKTAVTP